MFHVLAHVDAGAMAASCFEPAWIHQASARFGPAANRELGEDIATLATLLADEDVLASVQALAWRFERVEDVRAEAGRELFDPVTEVLRAAAELELDRIAAWDFSVSSIPDLSRLAPELDGCRIQAVRPLPRRGRAMEDRIFVGAPGIAGADPWHVGFQICHEAIVLRSEGAHDARELRALSLLRTRARREGLAEQHAVWLATLDTSSIGPIPDSA